MTKIVNAAAEGTLESKKILFDPCKKVTYHISLRDDEWHTIAPEPAARKDRQTYKLKRGWTHFFIDKLWKLYGIRCPFAFQNHQFFVSKNYPYLTFSGSCHECGNTIVGTLKTKPAAGDTITFDIETHDTSSLDHETSTHFAGDRRLVEQKILEHTKVKKYVDERDADDLDDSGTKPPHYVSQPVARTARQQAKDKKIGIDKYSSDPVEAILELAKDDEAVREVSVYPVKIYYWGENQITLWNEAAKLKIPISIDASGSISRPLNYYGNEKSSPIFIYNIVFRLENDEEIFSICQMLSSKHDTLTISKWLEAWLHSGAESPDQVTADCCLALLNAICFVFNLCYYLQYNDKCHTFVQEYREKLKRLKNKNEKVVMSCALPPCRVMRDRAHLIKSACKWKCFATGQNWTKKDFYVRAIAFCVEIENAEELEKVIIALLVLCQAQFFDEGSNCYEQYKTLNGKISTFVHQEPFVFKTADAQSTCQEEDCSMLHEFDGSEAIDSVSTYSTSIKSYLADLQAQSQVLIDEDHSKVYRKVNPYWLPSILKNIVRLYREYPSWTNVTRNNYSFNISPVATSTGSEVYFRILKKEYELIACSLQRFLLQHLKLLRGATKNGRRILKKYTSVKTKESVMVQESEKKSDTMKVTDPETDSCKINTNQITFHSHIRNGHLDYPVTINDQEVIFANTCGYDTLISIFIHAYESNSVFQAYINGNSVINGLFFQSIIGYSNRTMNMNDFYMNRGLLLLNYQLKKNQTYYNCECNSNNLLSNLLRNQISCEKIVHCQLCNYERVERLRVLIISDVFASMLIETNSPNIIHDCIVHLFEREELYCRQCRPGKPSAFGLTAVGFFLAIDGSKVFEDHDLSSADIPIRVNIHGNEFILVGFVVRLPPSTPKSMAHYVAYCYDNSKQIFEVKDDLMESSTTVTELPNNLKISTMIYVLNVVERD